MMFLNFAGRSAWMAVRITAGIIAAPFVPVAFVSILVVASLSLIAHARAPDEMFDDVFSTLG